MACQRPSPAIYIPEVLYGENVKIPDPCTSKRCVFFTGFYHNSFIKTTQPANQAPTFHLCLFPFLHAQALGWLTPLPSKVFFSFAYKLLDNSKLFSGVAQ